MLRIAPFRPLGSAGRSVWVVLSALLVITIGGCQAESSLRAAASTSLICTDGTSKIPLEHGDSKAVALIFITTDCPIANGYAPEINRLVSTYSSRGIMFCLVHVDPTVTVEQARKHAGEFGYVCPVVLDPRHTLVNAVGATVTPEAAVVTRDLELAYLGRIDDKHVDFGKKRVEPSQRDLQNTLDSVLAGRPITVARTKAVGCFMPDAAPADK